MISAFTPEDLRRFVAFESERYSSPGNAASMISALRGDFRFRNSCGDQVHGLIGVLADPIKRKLSSLPKALSSAEVEHLSGGGARRGGALGTSL